MKGCPAAHRELSGHGVYMGKGFRKFQRKMRVGAVIRAFLFGLSLGTVTMAALWLVAKRTATEPSLERYAVIGGAVALVGIAVVLALILPTDKRLARRLDRSLALGEKVQTMVAFRRDSGDMATLQRQDTERILVETPRRRVKGVCTWLFVLLPVLACLAVVGTVLVPAKEPPTPPPVVDNTFSLTPWQEQALKDLIETVRTSDMEAEPKEAVIIRLESLLIQLKSIKKESTMKETVIGTISSIHEVVSEHNTYDLIADAMANSPVEAVNRLGTSIRSLQPLLVGDQMNRLTEALTTDVRAETALLLASSIVQALKNTGVDTDNEVYTALADLAASLTAVTGETTDDEIAARMAEAEVAINNALYIQATNEQVEEDTIYRLLTIFGLAVSDLPDDLLTEIEDEDKTNSYDDKDDEDDEIHAGGLGTGEMIYGSDDMIYDPDSGTYVTYGEVIDAYFARISEQLADGKLSSELEDILTDYFAMLFNGTTADGGQGS